ncbi:hypothetical protein [Winogradskyella pacifica]|uniref:hypothetical protein n=1 Tax=Winogradskyella pacifica TaxID=664642 RepID=UPI0015F26EB1|nr:hypothetical protein [Winogradskyella pacifica]
MKLKNRALRILRYYLNCLWYHVIFPLGIEEDEFTKSWKNKERKNKVELLIAG